MEFLTKVAKFADEYNEAAEGTEGDLLKVASNNDVTYADMVALHNTTEANIFTQEGLIKVAGDAEPSRIALVGDLWEKIASEEIGEEGIRAFADQIDMSDSEIQFVLEAIDKQAEDAGIFDAELEADQETWDKVAEAHDFLVDAELDPSEALAFAGAYMNAESEEEGAGEKVAAEYGDMDQESFDKIAEAFDFLSDIENAPALMDELTKVARMPDPAAVEANSAANKKMFNSTDYSNGEKGSGKVTQGKKGTNTGKGGNYQENLTAKQKKMVKDHKPKVTNPMDAKLQTHKLTKKNLGKSVSKSFKNLSGSAKGRLAAGAAVGGAAIGAAGYMAGRNKDK